MDGGVTIRIHADVGSDSSILRLLFARALGPKLPITGGFSPLTSGAVGLRLEIRQQRLVNACAPEAGAHTADGLNYS
ncbi:hypothetical protein ARTHRO9AX_220357 [Arthrobacter sp. 9AX]|nr:hypothetical protein ARTHRO9AX_220357 [Arthrobacter sp. 9AX]